MRIWSVACTQAGFGHSLIGLGKFSEAKQALLNSLRNAEECGNWDLMLVPLMGFACLFAETSQFEQAVELAAFVANHRLSWNETKRRARTILETALCNLPQEVITTAQARGLSMTINEAVTYALEH